MQGVTLTVSELNDYVRRSLASDPILHNITISGEVSNFKVYSSGHWYFTLKDDLSRIDCAMFRQHNFNVRFLPRDGMKVLVKGSAGLYVQSGKYQFYAESMQQSGLGELYQRYMELKEKLTKEGLFDAARKRPLPLLPRKVGIVTSASGAVLHDIRTVAGRRFPGLPLVLRPAQVQGDGAAQDIARGVMEVSAVPGVDVIIVGRGGGSMEDLWTFNEESVVRAVSACRKPVISAVGHETDVTLCDLAADFRAPTPSAAAECAVPVRGDTLQAIASLQASLLDAFDWQIEQKEARLKLLSARLNAAQPENRLRAEAKRLKKAQEDLRAALDGAIMKKENDLAQRMRELEMLSPYRVLARGYAIVTKNGVPVRSGAQLAAGDFVNMRFADGAALAQVMDHSGKEDSHGG